MSFRDYLEEHFTVTVVSSGSELKFQNGECPFCHKSGEISLYINLKNRSRLLLALHDRVFPAPVCHGSGAM